MSRFFVFAALVATHSIASAGPQYQPPSCQRWTSDLSVCEVLGEPSTCDDSDSLEVEDARAEMFQGDAVSMCKKLFAHTSAPPPGYTSGMTVRACASFSNAALPKDQICVNAIGNPAVGTDVWCVFDQNNNGKFDFEDASYIGNHVNYAEVTPDPHCFCTPKSTNPHASLGPYTGPVYWWEERKVYEQWEFPATLKNQIAAQNLTGTASYRSDAAPFIPEEFAKLQRGKPNDANAAQVDHIMPRVDSKGCFCGAPVPENAALISRGLNGTMSNTSPKWNYWRAKMYQQFMTCPNPELVRYVGPKPPVQQQPDGSQEDEALPTAAQFQSAPYDDESDEQASGGCSAAFGGAGLTTIAIALAGLVRRRRAR